jgi:hypothetical protein
LSQFFEAFSKWLASPLLVRVVFLFGVNCRTIGFKAGVYFKTSKNMDNL